MNILKFNDRKTYSNILLILYRYNSVISLLILLIASYFIFFWRLGESPIRQWDESSLAVNGLEMSLNGNLIVKYIDGEPDLINTKPPLLTWLIAGCMKYFGYNEFALRLPSAVSALATVTIIYIFCIKYLRNSLAGLMSGLVLITSIGFTGEHVARTGDYDAMLVLWITIYSLSYFIYLDLEEGSKKNLYLGITTVALVLSVWTKGIAGILALPGLFIYTAYQKQFRKLLLSPRIYYSAIIFLTLALSYYAIRELYNPGYIKAVINNELTGRYMDLVPGGTQQGFFYYFIGMLSYRFIPWIYLLPACCIAAYASRTKIIRDFSVFGLIYLTFYFLIISYSKTKFAWYDAPLYPIGAIIVGLGLSTILNSFLARSSKKHSNDVPSSKQKFIYSLIIISIFLVSYLKNFYCEIYRDNIPYRQNDQAISVLALKYKNYFKELSNAEFKFEESKFKVVNSSRYNQPLLFYTEVAKLNSPYSLELKWEQPSDNIFSIGNVIVNCDSLIAKELQNRYIIRAVHKSGSCETSVIEGNK